MEFFDSSIFMPHGHCYLWRPDILWLHVISDAVIGLAYASIPFALIYLVRKRQDLAFNWIFILFGIFILACGATHIMEIVTVWNPIYGAEGIVKAITALASLGTAVALWPLLPKVLVLPSPSQLADANDGLQLEIVERQKAEVALEKRNAALVEAEKLKSEFLANVSHELRTPLTLILAPVESILAETTGDAALTDLQRQNLQTVHNNSLRLLQMVNGLLDFSKLEANKVEVKREPTNIVAATEAILTDFTPVIIAKNLELKTKFDVPAPIIVIDRYLFERIFFNLLSNAIKFTPEGGRVLVSLKQTDTRLAIAVTDTGVGISPDSRVHLFEKFKQLEGSVVRRFEGTGLGLALVKEFSQLLDGEVIVESEKGKGSTFTVDLLAPLSNQNTDRNFERHDHRHYDFKQLTKYEAVKPANQSMISEDAKQLPRVLIAEDNYELSTYIASILTGICQTRFSEDGDAALKQIDSWQPDLVISDVMMPKRDGLSLCRAIKTDPKFATIPVVLLTALTHREALLNGWEAGADEYLFKPFHPTELLTRIRTILTSVQTRKKAERKIKHYMAELKASNKELESFSYSVSHDLRAPLRAVDGFTKIVLEDFDADLPQDAKGYLKRVLENSEQMGQLIDDLLAFSRMGRTSMGRTKVDMNHLVAEIRRLLEQDYKGRDITWKVYPLPEAEADPTMMRLVWQNLIANAIKYTGPRSHAIIEIGSEQNEKEYMFFVKDNGVGFDMKYKSKLFGIFQRLHGSDEFEGNGIGLANVARIVSRHGGRVWAEAELGKGATFYFTLPSVLLETLPKA